MMIIFQIFCCSQHGVLRLLTKLEICIQSNKANMIWCMYIFWDFDQLDCLLFLVDADLTAETKQNWHIIQGIRWCTNTKYSKLEDWSNTPLNSKDWNNLFSFAMPYSIIIIIIVRMTFDGSYIIPAAEHWFIHSKMSKYAMVLIME